MKIEGFAYFGEVELVFEVWGCFVEFCRYFANAYNLVVYAVEFCESGCCDGFACAFECFLCDVGISECVGIGDDTCEQWRGCACCSDFGFEGGCEVYFELIK